MFGFNLQDVLKLGGTVASIGAVHEGFGCLQQVSKTRKPDRTETPKALFREGKTLTAINLALTIAKSFGQTALLVDCDFHQQQVHRYLGLETDKGIVDYLLDGVPLKDLIIWPKIDKLTLISGGRTVSESAELLGSQRMKDLVVEMKTRYGDRYVIFDVPPVLSGADALTFSQLVDGIIMVVEEGGTPLKEVEKALELIPKEKFLGFVLNKASITRKGYYGYYRQDAK